MTRLTLQRRSHTPPQPRTNTDIDDKRDDYVTMEMMEDLQPQEVAPPAYDTVANGNTNHASLPPLAISEDFLSNRPEVYTMRGHYRSPDFEIIRSDDMRIIEVETESTLVYHESSISNTLKKSNLFFLKRKSLEGDRRQYYADKPGRNGKRIFELETGPSMRSSGSMKLVFRNVFTSRLDAVYLQARPDGQGFDVLYQGQTIGDITQETKRKSPEFRLNIAVPGIDPLLFVIPALAVDDRVMDNRRRNRRSLFSGARGIGKGPGAGLAGAYALGAAI